VMDTREFTGVMRDVFVVAAVLPLSQVLVTLPKWRFE
jgi:hypothetical protein